MLVKDSGEPGKKIRWESSSIKVDGGDLEAISRKKSSVAGRKRVSGSGKSGRSHPWLRRPVVTGKPYQEKVIRVGEKTGERERKIMPKSPEPEEGGGDRKALSRKKSSAPYRSQGEDG